MGWYDKPGGLEEIADGVYMQVGAGSDSNQGIIVTNEGTVVVDTYVKSYVPLQESIEGLGQKSVRIVINTHNDYDHFSANHFFRRQGALVLSSAWCRNRIALMMSHESCFQEGKNRNPSLAHEATNPAELIQHMGIEKKHN